MVNSTARFSQYNSTFLNGIKIKNGPLLEEELCNFLFRLNKRDASCLKIRIFFGYTDEDERLRRYQEVYPDVVNPTITNSARAAFRSLIRSLTPWSSLILGSLSAPCKENLCHRRHLGLELTSLDSLKYLCYSDKREYMVEFMTVIHQLWKKGEFANKPN